MKSEYCCLAALCLALAAWPAVAQTTHTVTTVADAGAGSLRAAIAAAAGGDIIQFDAALASQTITLGGTELLIDENLTIDGSALFGAITIHGNQASRVFRVAAGRTVNLTAMTITGGTAAVGGGIYNNGNLTLENTTLAGNACTAYGGGIYNTDTGTIALNQSTLRSNSAGNSGGAIYNIGGTVALTNSTVSGNTAPFAGGGMLNSGWMVLRHATISGNSAGSYGGGIGNVNGTLSMDNTIVAGNTAAISPDLDNLNGRGNLFPPTGVCLLGNLEASGLSAGPTVLVGSPGLAPLGNYGGFTWTMPPLPGSPAVDAADAGLAVDQRGLNRPQGEAFDIGAAEMQVLVVTTPADSGPGSLRQAVEDVFSLASIRFDGSLDEGVIALGGTQILLDKNLTIDGSGLPGGITLSGEQTSRIFEVPGGVTVVLDSLTLTGGTSSAGGGAIYTRGALTLNRCTLSGNSATANANGGGIYMGSSSGALVLNACTLSGNTSAVNGGGLYVFSSLGNTMVLNNSTVSGNTAALYGGGIYNGRGRVTLNQTTVSDNASGTAGGGIYYLQDSSFGSVLAVNNAIVAGNVAAADADLAGAYNRVGVNLIGGDPGLAPLGDYGGPTRTMPPLSGSPAVDRVATGLPFDQRGFTRAKDGDRNGAALFDVGAVEVGPTWLVNTAADQGDGSVGDGLSLREALADRPPLPDPEEQRVLFDPGVFNGEPEDTIVLTHGSLPFTAVTRIDASTIAGGVTVSGNETSRLFAIGNGQSVTLDSLILTLGRSAGGGAIYNAGTLRLIRTRLAGNVSTSSGGGIYNLGNLALLESTLSNNAANGGGGGIYNLGNLALLESTLFNNAANGGGGGIDNSGTLTLQRSTLMNNLAARGGGIANLGTLALVASTVSGNVATGTGSDQGGGGVYLHSGDATLDHATVAGNVAAHGGGLFSLSGTVSLRHSIVAGNEASTAGPDVDATRFGGIPPVPSGVNLLGDLAGSGLVAGSSVRVGDPLLAPLATYGGPTPTRPPRPGSPALDVETSGPAADQRGLARPQGSGFDLGAVEFLPAVVNTVADEDGLEPGTGLSLREATAHPFASTITFDPTVFDRGGSIRLAHGRIPLNQGLMIDASANKGGVTVSGEDATPVFWVAAGQTVSLDSLTLTRGRGQYGGAILNQGFLALSRCTVRGNAASGGGGGLFNDAGSLTLENSTVFGNIADTAGGIYNQTGVLTLNNSTLANNSSTGTAGGGIFSDSGASPTSTLVILNDSTVSGNASATTGGGIDISGGTLTLNNAIVAGNRAASGGQDLSATSAAILLPPGGVSLLGDLAGSGLSAGSSILVGDPRLAPLHNYGGLTPTMPPLPGSPAVDASLSGPAADQRGLSRPVGIRFDLGAVEAVPTLLPPEIDTDDDNIDDRLEPLYPQFALGVNDLAVDSDHDGAPDWEEIYFHTDLYNDNSYYFGIQSFGPSEDENPALVARWVADDWAGGTAPWIDRIGGKIVTVADPEQSPAKTPAVFPGGGGSTSAGLVFDGVDDFMSVAATENPIEGRTTVTIAAYILTRQGASYQDEDPSFFLLPGPLNGESPGERNDWGLTYDAAGNAQAFFNVAITPSPAVSLIDGLPHTLVLTWQDPTEFSGEGVARLYVDGLQVGNTGTPTDGGAYGIVEDEFLIGSSSYYDTVPRFFGGAIGELRFYDTIQDPVAVHAELTGTRPPTASLTFYAVRGMPYELESGAALPDFGILPYAKIRATQRIQSIWVDEPFDHEFFRVRPGWTTGDNAYGRWASRVVGFSSQYHTNLYSAARALGPPDRYPTYGPDYNAWSSLTPDSQPEYIELGFDDPSRISSVSVYETFNPGAVNKVSVRDPDTGLWVQVWSGPAVPAPPVARIFTVTFPLTPHPVDEVRIDLDSPAVPHFSHIDAVSIR